MDVEAVVAPSDGVWRVGRAPDPLATRKPLPASALDKANTGNRFDSPTGTYRTLYFATTLAGCFGETLARFRPDLALQAVIGAEWGELGFMTIGDIPADWRVRRLGVRVSFNDAEGRFPHGVQFLDVESAETREALRPELAALLAFYGYDDLDVPMVRGRDRRVTRWISQWAYEATGEDGRPLYAGIRYVSRLNSDWTCWAVFDDVSIDELTRRPILVTDPDYRAVAKLYGLNPY